MNKHNLKSQSLGLLFALTAGMASAQSTITLDSFDLTEPTQKIEQKQSPAPVAAIRKLFVQAQRGGLRSGEKQQSII